MQPEERLNFGDLDEKKKERKAWKSLSFVEGSLPQPPDCGLGRWRNQMIWLIYVYLLDKCVSKCYFRCHFLQTCSTQTVPLWASSSPSEKSPYKVCPTGRYLWPKSPVLITEQAITSRQHSYLTLIVFYLFNFFFFRIKLTLISHWADNNQMASRRHWRSRWGMRGGEVMPTKHQDNSRRDGHKRRTQDIVCVSTGDANNKMDSSSLLEHKHAGVGINTLIYYP